MVSGHVQCQLLVSSLLQLAPRTREGYYHYTGGVEVWCTPLIDLLKDLTSFS